MKRILRKSLKNIRIGKPVTHKFITVLPLFSDHEETCRYVTAKEAFDSGKLAVTEVSEHGTVGFLNARNDFDKELLIIAGEGLKGAKQDRIVNVSVIIAAMSEERIYVSCIEQGRWVYKSRQFGKANYASSKIRCSIVKDINRSAKEEKLFKSDQGKVWDEVDKLREKHKVMSATGNLNDVYSKIDKEIKTSLKKLKYVKDSTGLALFIDGKLVSLDLFPHPSIAKVQWNDIVRSCIVDIDDYEGDKEMLFSNSSDDSRKMVKNLLTEISLKAEIIKGNPGLGRYMSCTGSGLNAGVLLDKEGIAHMSAFAE